MTTGPECRERVEEFLNATFSNIRDQFGQRLVITPALPKLAEVTMHYDNPRFDSHRFLGESARIFTIRWIITSTFPNLNAENLALHNRKCQDIGRLSKLVFAGTDMKKKIGVNAHTILLDLYLGVLVESFGMAAVRGFLEPAIQSMLRNDVSKAKAPNFEPETDVDPKQQLRQAVDAYGGEFKIETASAPDGQWQATVTCQLVQAGTIFIHTRLGPSKQKASSAACFDILRYLDLHNNILTQLLVPTNDTTQAHVLPIHPSDYSNITVSTTTMKITQPNLQTHPNRGNWAQIPHSNDQEETMRQLSLLLLGNNETSPNTPQPTKMGQLEVNNLLCQMKSSMPAGPASFDYIKQEMK